MGRLKETVKDLYEGDSNQATFFRFALLGFDILTLGFFIFVTVLQAHPLWVFTLDAIIAIVIFADFLARLIIAPVKWRYLTRLTTFADLIVIVTLLLPAFVENFIFLRVLRALRLLRSYHTLRELRTRYAFFKRNEDVIQSVINLFVFIFVMTALVYVFQVRTNDQINNYIDALYFTVTTLTTTGFGDVTLHGSGGRLLAVFVMIVGVALFLRLVQTIFRPQKVNYTCKGCGLRRHDPDAIHCKHCGLLVNIETDGD